MKTQSANGSGMSVEEYQHNAQRTCSNMFFGEYVNIRELIATINDCIVATAKLDKAKKLLFYGRGVTDIKEPQLAELKRDPFNTLGSIPMGGDDEKILHALLGAHTETAELLEPLRDALVAYMTGASKTLKYNAVQIFEEWGGVFWYGAICHDAMQTRMGDTFLLNIAQLRARFPEKFNCIEANHRNLAFEKSVMSSVVGVATPETYSGHGPTADEEVARFVAQDEMAQQPGECSEEWADRIQASMS